MQKQEQIIPFEEQFRRFSVWRERTRTRVQNMTPRFSKSVYRILDIAYVVAVTVLIVLTTQFYEHETIGYLSYLVYPLIMIAVPFFLRRLIIAALTSLRGILWLALEALIIVWIAGTGIAWMFYVVDAPQQYAVLMLIVVSICWTIAWLFVSLLADTEVLGAANRILIAVFTIIFSVSGLVPMVFEIDPDAFLGFSTRLIAATSLFLLSVVLLSEAIVSTYYYWMGRYGDELAKGPRSTGEAACE